MQGAETTTSFQFYYFLSTLEDEKKGGKINVTWGERERERKRGTSSNNTR